MSDKLSPKPTNRNLHNWNDLNSYLQMIFSSGSIKDTNIIPSSYEMSKEEIIFELEKNNYTVVDKGEHLVIS